MVGFDNGDEQDRRLNGQKVERINADLTAAADVTTAKSLAEMLGIAFVGDTKKGKFDIPGPVAEAMLADERHPEGKSNRDVIRPWINGLDIT